MLLALEKYKKQRDYWFEQLKYVPLEPMIPYKTHAYLPKKIAKGAGADREFFAMPLPPDLSASILTLSKNSDLSLHVFLLAAFMTLLHIYTGKSEVLLASPVYQALFSYKLINDMVVIRNAIDGNETFKEILINVKETFIKACQNQEYPFEKILRDLGYHNGKSTDFFFDLIFYSQNTQKFDESEGNGLNKANNLLVSYQRTGSDILFTFRYNKHLYYGESLKSLGQYFIRLLDKVVTNISKNLAHIDLLSGEEKQNVLWGFNDNQLDYPKNKTIVELFEQQVGKTPTNIALAYENQQLDYRKLNHQSNQLARLLRVKHVGPDSVVGIMLDRSVEMLIAIVGILKAGGAYLPIEPSSPRNRICYMLKDSNTHLILSHRRLKTKIPTLSYNIETIYPENSEIFNQSDHNPIPLNTPGNLAYLIYTSGSTGGPKAVMVEHQNVVNLVAGLKRRIYDKLSGYLRVCLLAPYVFDASVQQIFAALLQGHALHIVPEETRIIACSLLHFYRKYQIHISDGTPIHIRFLGNSIEEKIDGLPIKHFIIGGERLPLEVTTRFLEKFNSLPPHITNVYGPTECCVDSTSYRVTKEGINRMTFIPIGRPMPNENIYILDEKQKIVPTGVAAELYIAGDGVARGYLNQSDLNQQKFMGNPFIPGQRMYRTGDLARWLEDSNIEFLGRNDQQVKIRGFRVEIGDIEKCLLKHEFVKDVVVITRENGGENITLCAYYVPVRQGINFQASELRLFLDQELPDYMIPSHFIALDKIPVTVNGKVDTAALPQPALYIESKYTEPRNYLETELVKLWSRILKLDEKNIGIDTHFRELGANSLTLTLLISAIQKKWNIKISFSEMQKEMTIRQISENLERKEYRTCRTDEEELVLLKKGSPQQLNLFFIHGASGETSGYLELCRHLNSGVTCWGIQADKLENAAPKNLSVKSLAEDYIEKIKRIQKFSPYRIIGGGTGATIGFEMVRQLEETQQEVALFIIIDAVAPNGNCDSVTSENEFTLQSELNWVKRHLKGYMEDHRIKEVVKHVNRLDQLWPAIIKYFETNNVNVENIKKMFANDLSQLLPYFSHLGIGDLIYSLNMWKTFTRARDNYRTDKKIKARAHYVGASQSNYMIKHNWDNYLFVPIIKHEFNGNHYELLQRPTVLDVAPIIDRLIINESV